MTDTRDRHSGGSGGSPIGDEAWLQRLDAMGRGLGASSASSPPPDFLRALAGRRRSVLVRQMVGVGVAAAGVVTGAWLMIRTLAPLPELPLESDGEVALYPGDWRLRHADLTREDEPERGPQPSLIGPAARPDSPEVSRIMSPE